MAWNVVIGEGRQERCELGECTDSIEIQAQGLLCDVKAGMAVQLVEETVY